MVFAALIPTINEPINPGSAVTAILSMSSYVKPASFIAASITYVIFSICLLLATSGTTPPYNLWISICVYTTLHKTVLPSSTMATLVSSQLDSIAKIFI